MCIRDRYQRRVHGNYVQSKEFLLEITTPKYSKVAFNENENKQLGIFSEAKKKEQRMIPPRILIEKQMKDQKIANQIKKKKKKKKSTLR
eukprot:TRINITY_DN17761_c0_g1_i1.p2 TRINITY_DN17761_c0_g1~~TRINITY_DN17761_c0_g1_i1.p2  ORF type:complete len:104 (+),score=31.58 TRINITY_DN17761_c0_g1_i1:47-313(+)